MSSELSEKLITWLHSVNQKARNSINTYILYTEGVMRYTDVV